jgi:hypothetical protein
MLLLFIIHAYEAIGDIAEVNVGAALLQISKQSKSAWSNHSTLPKDSGRMPISLVAPARMHSNLSMQSNLSYCRRYWQGKRKKDGDCPSGCKYPEVGRGADWNGGKDLNADGFCTTLASQVYPEQNSRYCGEGPDYMHEDGLDCRGCAGNSAEDKDSPKPSSFHDIVGQDGVYMISVNCRTERFDFAAQRLKEVGITPIFFSATESTASWEQLAQGCEPQGVSDGQCTGGYKPGWGCETAVEQAIADSHRRAIEAATGRNAEWTAILEDDSVPAMAEDGLWTDRLMKVWSEVPAEVEVVRLGWCAMEDPYHRWEADSNNFVIADTPDAGGCTHAYVVRQSALPKLSAFFPCCCAVDCCFKFGMERSGMKMVNIDAAGSKDYIATKMTQDWGNAYGIMMQAKDDLPTVRGR